MNLELLKELLSVTTLPSGAAIFIDGLKCGVSPLDNFTVFKGPHTIRAEMEGYKTEIQMLETISEKGVSLTLELTPDNDPVTLKRTGKEMVLVDQGQIRMGSSDGDADEKPLHQVRVSPFYIGMYTVTQGLWKTVMGNNPSSRERGLGDDYPVNSISWNSAVVFCNTLSQQEGFTSCYSRKNSDIKCNFEADGYRLPTEAEWEFAARGGVKSQNFTYSGGNILDQVGWYQENGFSTTHPVGSKTGNELGLFDMSGNVWEWCWDHYGSYHSEAQRDPLGSTEGQNHVSRGGSWCIIDWDCRTTFRYYGNPTLRFDFQGFRLARRG